MKIPVCIRLIDNRDISGRILNHLTNIKGIEKLDKDKDNHGLQLIYLEKLNHERELIR